ncbi:MAG: DUF4129 domain-containing protein [Lachnospiraceae bacterium]|nr:DUF4129 domain-containing protein [Lachnospiraceae bacterium]
MNNKIQTVRDIICVLMCSLTVLLLYLYFSEIFLASDRKNPMCIIYIAAICLADYFLRKYITRAIMFFSLRLLFLPLTLVCISNDTELMLLIIIFLTFYTMGVTFWKSEISHRRLSAVDMPIECIVLFIGIYFHASLDMSSGLAEYAYISGIIYILLHFLRLYLDKFLGMSLHLEDNPSSLTRSFRMNSSFVLLFLFFLILFIFILNIFFHNDSFNFIGTFLKYIASLFFGFFLRFKGETVIQEPESTDMSSWESGLAPEIPTDNFVPHNTASNPVMNTLFYIFQVMLYIGIVFAILYALYKFFKTYMYRNRETDDIVEKIQSKDKTEKKNDSFRVKFKIFLSNREKVRKIYQNIISNKLKRNRRIIIHRSDTPEEIYHKLSDNSHDSQRNLKDLTAMYEKARYSASDISSEELKSAVKMAKSLKN